MHSETAIEQCHNIKVFCYMIVVFNGRHFEFIGNFRSMSIYLKTLFKNKLFFLYIMFYSSDHRKNWLHSGKNAKTNQIFQNESTIIIIIYINWKYILHRKWRLPIWGSYSRRGRNTRNNQSKPSRMYLSTLIFFILLMYRSF